MCDPGALIDEATSFLSDTASNVGTAVGDLASSATGAVGDLATAAGNLVPDFQTLSSTVGDVSAPAVSAATAPATQAAAAITPTLGAAVPAGMASETAAEAIAAQGGAAGALGAAEAGPNVGSLLNASPAGEPDAAAPAFGSDKVPFQATEGKPMIPDNQIKAGGGGGINDFLNSPLTKLGLGVGAAALPLIAGQPSVPKSAAPLQPGGAVSAPLIAAETSQLNAATAGTLTAPQAAQIATYKQSAQNQLFQSLANSGVADPTKDSRYISGLAEIDRQAMGATETFIQDSFKTGFAAAGQAQGALSTAANAEISSDQAFQDALKNAITSFGLIQGLGDDTTKKKAA